MRPLKVCAPCMFTLFECLTVKIIRIQENLFDNDNQRLYHTELSMKGSDSSYPSHLLLLRIILSGRSVSVEGCGSIMSVGVNPNSFFDFILANEANSEPVFRFIREFSEWSEFSSFVFSVLIRDFLAISCLVLLELLRSSLTALGIVAHYSVCNYKTDGYRLTKSRLVDND